MWRKQWCLKKNTAEYASSCTCNLFSCHFHIHYIDPVDWKKKSLWTTKLLIVIYMLNGCPYLFIGFIIIIPPLLLMIPPKIIIYSEGIRHMNTYLVIFLGVHFNGSNWIMYYLASIYWVWNEFGYGMFISSSPTPFGFLPFNLGHTNNY